MKSTLFLFACLFGGLPLYAQIQSVSAKITDLKGIPLSGNLSITDSSGNAVHSSSFNGNIAVSGLSQRYIRIKLSSILFKDTTISVLYKQVSAVDLGTIIPKEASTALGQVTISASQPIIGYGNNGNLEINVAGTILATSSSVNEILSRTPGLSLSEGVISVQGKGEAIVYLNGILIPAERLSSIPTSQISKIEVINNPSSRYDAAGRAVINITSRAPRGSGLNARLSQHITSSKFAGTNSNSFADFGYMKNRLNFSSNVALLKGSGRELLYTVRNRPEPSDYLNSALSTDWNRDYNVYATYGASAKYRFSSGSVVSLSYSGNRDHLGGTVVSRNQISTMNGNNDYGSDIQRDELRMNNTLTADFSKTTDTLGSAIFLSAQHAAYQTGNEDKIQEFGGSIPRKLQNTFSQHLNVTSVQADRSKEFSKAFKLETGLRLSHVGNQSDTRFLIADGPFGTYHFDETLSSLFSYKETIGAAYANFSAQAGKLHMDMGLRGEWTTYNLGTTAGQGQHFKKSYMNLFPNVQAELPLKNGAKLRVSYTSRITRPRYQALNPFVTYQDAFTTIEGNPNLIPEKAHAFELGANFEKTEFKMGYTHTIDPLAGAALRGNTPESYVLKSINRSHDHTFFASVTRIFSIGNWWQSANIASITYGRSFDNQYEYATGKVSPQAYLYTSNTFDVKNGIKLQLLAWFLGERYYGIRHDNKRSLVTAGVEKALLKGKLKISLTANDIFSKSFAEGDYNVGKTQVYYKRRYDNNHIKLTASYKIGSSQTSSPVKPQLQSETNRAN